MPSAPDSAPVRLDASISSRNDFYNYVDQTLAAGCSEGMGIAFFRLKNVNNFSMREGIRASDHLADVFVEELERLLGSDAIVIRYSGISMLALTLQSRLMKLIVGVSDELALIDQSRSVQVKAGFCEAYDGCSAREMVARARYALDDIMFESGRSLRIFDEDLSIAYERRRYVIDHINDAIEQGEIRAYAQPIVRLITGRVCEVEILARWESKRFGFIGPNEFVPVLEESRQIHRLDVEVIRLACKQWHEANSLGVSVPFGINLSRLDFELCDVYRAVRDIMKEYDVPVEMLHVEVTESAMTGNEDLFRRGVKRFRDGGFKVYMDDYGTGYSSLEGLLSSNYDVVKLDKSLIDDVETNERARVIVTDAVSMCKRLGMQTLCEGVETLEQLLFLRMVGCEKCQGFFFGKPVDHEGTMLRLTQEAERYEEPGLDEYLDKVGRVNLIDGSRSDVRGSESHILLGDTPIAVIEGCDGHIFCLTNNPAFDEFLRRIGLDSFDDMIHRITAGEGTMRKRFELAAIRAKETGTNQVVDFIAGGYFSTLSFSRIASVGKRNAYLVKVSSVSSSGNVERERTMEMALPFVFAIYKRIDLFDLNTGASKNLYLSSPLLQSHRMAGIAIDEIREFCDRNVHPADRDRFMDFYDLSTLDDRVQRHGGRHDTIVLRTRISRDSYSDHIYMLIPMTLNGHRQVLSTLREVDVGESNNFQVSGDARISDATLLSAVLEGIDRYVFWKDDQRRFLGANQAFLDYYGFKSLDEIVGKTDEEVGWHVDDAPFRSDEWRVLRGEVVQRARGTCYGRNELRNIEANKRPIIASGRIVGLLGYFRDLGPAEHEYRP